MMTVLYELIDLLPASFTPAFSPQLNKLFLFLQKNRRLTEVEASAQFFGKEGENKYFNKLKNKLRIKLTNHIIINPSVWANTKQKEIVDEFYKNFTTYKIFLANNSAHTGFEIARKILPVARDMEIHSLVYEISSDLQLYYSGINISPGKSLKYGKIAKASIEFIQAEEVIKRHYNQVVLVCNTRNSFSTDTLENFKSVVSEIKPYLKLRSEKLGRMIYNIIIATNYAEYRYEQIISYCKEALEYSSPDHINYNAFRFSFLQKQIPALIALHRFDEAKEIAKESLQMMPVGKFNWHLIFIQKLMIHFHAGSYQEAYESYKSHLKYGCKYQTLTEYWNIMKGYLYFLIQAGKINPHTEERFNLGRFLNDVPIYNRDKEGININILILQILIQMQRNQFGRIIDYIDSLKAYARKYTRNPETARANIFINMIIKAEAASFHRAATERKTQKLFEKLKATQIKSNQNISNEFVPYEILWDTILNMLGNKFRGTTTKKTRHNVQ